MRNSSARRYACRISRKWCQTLTYKLLNGRVETKEFPSHFPLNAKEDTATFFLMLGYRSNCLHEETDIGFWSGNLFQYILNKILHCKKSLHFFPACFAEIFSLIFSEKSIVSVGIFTVLVVKRLHCALKITWMLLLWFNYCIESCAEKNWSIHKPEHNQIYVTDTTIFFKLSPNIFNPVW